MTPTEILMSATANAADAVGLGDQIGTLAVGKQADVIIVNGNPFENLRAMRGVSVVIKAGEVVFPDDVAD
jgi:imidazolonepropionase-like amidohydrolase